MASLKAKESIDGPMDKYILEISIRGSNMEKENGRAQRMLYPLIVTMESIKRIKRVDMEFILGLVAISIKETILMMRGMEMDRCSGPMEVCMRVSGLEASSTELEEWFSLMDQPKKDISKTMYSSILLMEALSYQSKGSIKIHNNIK